MRLNVKVDGSPISRYCDEDKRLSLEGDMFIAIICRVGIVFTGDCIYAWCYIAISARRKSHYYQRCVSVLYSICYFTSSLFWLVLLGKRNECEKRVGRVLWLFLTLIGVHIWGDLLLLFTHVFPLKRYSVSYMPTKPKILAKLVD